MLVTKLNLDNLRKMRDKQIMQSRNKINRLDRYLAAIDEGKVAEFHRSRGRQ